MGAKPIDLGLAKIPSYKKNAAKMRSRGKNRGNSHLNDLRARTGQQQAAKKLILEED